MQTKLALAALALANLPFAAHAAVSDDLVFCSKLNSPKERIACYDAAARIAARGTVAAQAPAPARMVTKQAADHPGSTAVAEPIERNRFQGAFATIGGSYGISSPRSASVGVGGFFTANFSDQFVAEGWSGRATAGYNATIGNFLFGVELAGRFGNESASGDAGAFTPLQPFFGLFGGSTASYAIKNDIGLHLAGRAGVTFGDTLAFVRGGVGVSRVTESAALDGRNLFSCTQFNGINCVAFVPGTLTTQTKRDWIPSALIGAGFEHNIGPAFVRLEGEIEAVALHNRTFGGIAQSGMPAEPYWFARAIVAAGIRF